MQVKELTKKVSGNEEASVSMLKDVAFEEDSLRIGDRNLEVDDSTVNMMSEFLGLQQTYIKKCPAELRRINLNYWLDHYGDREAQFHTLGNSLHQVAKVDAKIIPVSSIAKIATNVFDPEDEVRELHVEPNYLHLDVTSSKNQITVEGFGTTHRPVDDVTHAGLRFISYPTREEAPTMQTYFHRLFCSNGMGHDEPEMKIRLRGNTVDEVLADMEAKAQLLMAGLPERLERYRATSEIEVPGSLERFALQVGKERELGSRVMDTVLARLTEIPSDRPATVYDVLNAFTSVANEDVHYSSRMRLQQVGGDLALNTQNMVHRCSTCQQRVG